MEKVVIWGAGGHAKVVADILRLTGFEIAGFIDDVDPRRKGEAFFGARVLGGAEVLDAPGDVRRAIVAFGDNAARAFAAERLAGKGFDLVRAIHPAAVVAADAIIGPGAAIMAGAVINPSSRVGASVIVNTRASVDHDCVIEPGAHVGPGVTLGGRVRVGAGAWLGIGSTVLDGRVVGARAIVAAGAVVVRDVPDDATVMGVPAKVRS